MGGSNVGGEGSRGPDEEGWGERLERLPQRRRRTSGKGNIGGQDWRAVWGERGSLGLAVEVWRAEAKRAGVGAGKENQGWVRARERPGEAALRGGQPERGSRGVYPGPGRGRRRGVSLDGDSGLGAKSPGWAREPGREGCAGTWDGWVVEGATPGRDRVNFEAERRSSFSPLPGLRWGPL